MGWTEKKLDKQERVHFKVASLKKKGKMKDWAICDQFLLNLLITLNQFNFSGRSWWKDEKELHVIHVLH